MGFRKTLDIATVSSARFTSGPDITVYLMIADFNSFKRTSNII
jgi:hypothetical protein